MLDKQLDESIAKLLPRLVARSRRESDSCRISRRRPEEETERIGMLIQLPTGIHGYLELKLRPGIFISDTCHKL